MPGQSPPIFSLVRSLGDKTLPGDHLGIGGITIGTHRQTVRFQRQRDQTDGRRNNRDYPMSWNHVALVRDGQRMKVFLNGQLEIDGELQSTFGDSMEFCLASRSDNFAPLDGNLAEFAFVLASDHRRRGVAVCTQRPGNLAVFVRGPIDGYAMGVREKAKPSDCKIHINGEGSKLGPVVPRGFLTCLSNRSGEESSPGEDNLR